MLILLYRITDFSFFILIKNSSAQNAPLGFKKNPVFKTGFLKFQANGFVYFLCLTLEITTGVIVISINRGNKPVEPAIEFGTSEQ